MKNSDEIKKAAALSYKKGDAAPIITALGKGKIAERIISTAQKNNIPLFKDDALIDTLLNFELGSEIPPELYEIVAEILAFICHLDKIRGDENAK